MLAKDMITTAAFTQPVQGPEEDRDICLQQFCAERGKAGGHITLGKKAKKLYLDDHPGYTFPKKDVYANGQLIQANRWVESIGPTWSARSTCSEAQKEGRCPRAITW